MDHIMISHDKLKLMLTDADLAHYRLNMQELDSESALTRQTFRELLADVKRMSGFDAADDKVFIQLYPSRDGGAEIYITRLSQSREPEEREEAPAFITMTTVCVFDSMENLLQACAHMQSAMPQESSAWQECGADGRKEKYYLVMEDRIACRDYLHGERPSERRKFIGDYGKIITDSTAIYYVKEHCFNFCEKNAVKILSSMI